VAIYDSRKDKFFCPVCGENVDISRIELSYAFKLMLDEFKAMTIYPKMHLKSKY
jgi:DNA-directed RNA polymerase subunit B